MSNARPGYIHALSILLALAILPVGAFAQDDSQPAEPTTSISTLGTSVYINGSAPDNGSMQVAEKSAPSLQDAPPASGQTMKSTPPPPEVNQVTQQMKYDARHWHVGGRVGAGFSPELFMFGLQSQIGPIFAPRLLFRPNANFSFGELTDMVGLNLEAAYQFRQTAFDRWTPYFGLGPSLNFIHRGTTASDISFSNFTYKTGFNVFVGGQKGKTFVEMKTSLWSGPAPVLRLIVGYNF